MASEVRELLTLAVGGWEWQGNQQAHGGAHKILILYLSANYICVSYRENSLSWTLDHLYAICMLFILNKSFHCAPNTFPPRECGTTTSFFIMISAAPAQNLTCWCLLSG